MQKTKKTRINLYISRDLLEFARDWSYVTQIPVSGMLEEYLIRQRDIVATATPFQWLNDPIINPSLPPEDKHFRDLEEYVKNREEEEFCQENPDHPRAKMRRALLKEHEKYQMEKLEQQKVKEKELIKRWMEVFQAKDKTS